MSDINYTAVVDACSITTLAELIQALNEVHTQGPVPGRASFYIDDDCNLSFAWS